MSKPPANIILFWRTISLNIKWKTTRADLADATWNWTGDEGSLQSKTERKINVERWMDELIDWIDGWMVKSTECDKDAESMPKDVRGQMRFRHLQSLFIHTVIYCRIGCVCVCVCVPVYALFSSVSIHIFLSCFCSDFCL